MEKIDNRTMPVYLKEELAQAAKNDWQLAKAMDEKPFDKMLADMWSALRKFAQSEGSGSVGVDVPNQVILSIAIHWYTEDKPTIDSMVAMMKEGGCAFKCKSNAPNAAPKSLPSNGTTRVEAPAKPKTQSKPSAKPSKPAAKTVSIPKPKVVEVVSMFEDFDVD